MQKYVVILALSEVEWGRIPVFAVAVVCSFKKVRRKL
jgi:hypothetical protein